MAGVKSFLEALEEKYADNQVAPSANVFIMNNMDVAGESGKVRVPREMSLHQCGVTHAGDPGDLIKVAHICGQVTTLDLAQNHITQWSEVFQLLSCMPRVSFLNLSENILVLPPTATTTYPTLTKLALNVAFVTMETLDKLLPLFPNLAELHLCMNDLSSVSLSGSYPNVKALFLNGNQFSDFREILKLSPIFPELEQLLLIGNPICELGEPSGLAANYPCLSCLNLSECKLSRWEEVERLKHLPALTDVRLKSLPLYGDLDEKLRRQLVIAYLPNITRLNLSSISRTERESAERTFIRHYLNMQDKPLRFDELRQKHGEVCQFADVDLKPEFQKTVEVHYNGKVCIKEIDVRHSCAELKKRLAEEVAGCNTKELKMYHYDPAIAFGADYLKYPKKLLHSLPVRDGDRFYLEPKDQLNGVLRQGVEDESSIPKANIRVCFATKTKAQNPDTIGALAAPAPPTQPQ